MNRKTAMLFILAIAVCLAAIGIFSILRGDSTQDIHESQKSITSITAEAVGMSLEYSEPLQAEMLSPEDQKDKFLVRLTSNNPAMLVSVKYEDGLKAASAFSKQDSFNLIKENAERALPQRYPEYKQIESRELSVGNKQAFERVFTYKGPSGEVAKQHLMVVLKDSDTAVHIAAQAQESEFDTLDNQYFQAVFDSVAFQL